MSTPATTESAPAPSSAAPNVAAQSAPPLADESAWSPVQNRVYRGLWIASIVSSGGTMMQDTGAAWLMTNLAASPFTVALMQVAASLPVFLFALPAGAVADILDRRRLLLVAQITMCLAATTIGVLTLLGAITPWLLLLLTFVIGIGATFSDPASRASLGEIVGKGEVPKAVTLNSVTINIARVWGPPLGGLIVARGGAGLVFLLNALTFLVTFITIYRWRHKPRQSKLPRERFTGAIASELRYVRYSPTLRAVLVRVVPFVFCGGAVWALLPSLAQGELNLGATGYGMLMGLVGAGALGAASLLPRIHKAVQIDPLLSVATVVLASVVVALAYVREFYLLCPVILVGGAAWVTLVSTYNVSAGSQGPAWAKARVFAVYILAFQGGTAIGSLCWGAIAERTGVPNALLLIAGGLIAGLPLAFRYKLKAGQGLNLEPAHGWAEPPVVGEEMMERGPVMVTVEYQIDPARAAEFERAMHNLELERRRDGAFFWGLFVNPTDPARYVEFFAEASWVEHLRHHARVTVADQDTQRLAQAFQVGDAPPVTTHLVAERARQEPR